jgi:hypothetical protein
MWAMLPYSLRLACSWAAFKVSAKDLREGIEATVFDRRPGRELTFTALELDEFGWNRVISALDADFEAIFREQEDARFRVAEGSGELLRIGVLQLGFESRRSAGELSLELADGLTEPPIPFPERLAPVFADDLMREILMELNRRFLSVPQYHREFASGVSEGVIRHRFVRLRKLGLAEIVDKIRRRGTEEHIYRATKPAVVDNGPWADVPDAVRKSKVDRQSRSAGSE